MQHAPTTNDALAAANDTARPYPSNDSIAKLFEEVVRTAPEAVALTWGDPLKPDAMTYSTLDAIAGAYAAILLEAGAKEDDVVGVEEGNGAATIAAIVGILKAGCAYMPVNPSLPASRIAGMCRLSKCRIAITDYRTEEKIGATASGIRIVKHPAAQRRFDQISKSDAGNSPAYVLFTSGSTGEPKAVAVPQKAVARLIFNNGFHAFGPRESMVATAPLSFDASTLEIWGSLLCGGQLHLADHGDILDHAKLGRIIKDRGITTLWLTTSLLHHVADVAPEILRPLETLIVGGETLSPRHARAVMDACPDLALINGYGPTENTTFSTTWRVRREDLDGPIPIGRPISNSRVYVVDSQNRPLPAGETGEIAVAGDGLAIGYMGRADLSDASFVRLPTSPGERIYLTGDIGRWRPDGVLEFGGRRDSQVKIRGYRIEPGEIEANILAHPSVGECAVAIDKSSDSQYSIRAFVTLVENRADTVENIAEYLEARLPSYTLPEIVIVDKMPRTDSGKIDRKNLSQIKAPATDRANSAGQVTAPITGPVQEYLALLWSRHLGRPVDDARADFFQIGGHSLLAAKLISAMGKSFRVEYPFKAFFDESTIEACEKQLEQLVGDRDLLVKMAKLRLELARLSKEEITAKLQARG